MFACVVSTVLLTLLAPVRTPMTSEFVMNVQGRYAFERPYERAAGLQRNQHSLAISDELQSNVLEGKAPEHDIFDHAVGAGKTTGHVCAVNPGALVRLELLRELFISADLRQMLVGHSSSNRRNGGADYPTTGGVTFRGTFSHEQKNDTGALMLGGGLHF